MLRAKPCVDWHGIPALGDVAAMLAAGPITLGGVRLHTIEICRFQAKLLTPLKNAGYAGERLHPSLSLSGCNALPAMLACLLAQYGKR